MQKKLLTKMFLTGLLGIVFTALAACLLYYHIFSVQVRHDMNQLIRVYAHAYEQSGLMPATLTDIRDEYRLTLIDQDGTVLSDSKASGILENHADRPEVQEAFSSGYGSDERISSTFSVQTFYEAMLLSDGTVLRVSVNTASIYAIFLTALPCLGLVLCLLTTLAFLLSETLTRSLVRPITDMGKHLDRVEEFVPYPELKPFAEALAEDRDLRMGREQFRREFTANVSHELKTPLTSISGYAELIAGGLVEQEDIPSFGEQIRREAQRMITLVSDIIKLSELDSRPTAVKDPEPEPVELSQLCTQTLETLRLRARKGQITLLQTGEPVTVMGSPNLLLELTENLVDNAVRYNRPNGSVTVTTGLDHARPFLRVQDNGIGIPRAAQSRVFERFYRVDKSRSKATGGTGLGLAIVKHIALLHHGEIVLESEEGVGTTVTVWFPRENG